MTGRQRSLRYLLFCFTLFSIAVTFGGIFINIYIWQGGRDLAHVGLYNISFFVMTLFSTLVGNYFIRMFHSRVVFVVASLLVMLTFVLLPWVTDDVGTILLVGGIFGMAVGFFYVGFNLYALVLTNDATRAYILSMEEVLGRLTGLLVPVLSSALLTYFGYISTFSLLALLMLSFVLFSFFTPKYKSQFSLRRINIGRIWDEYKPVLLSLVAFGFMNGLMTIASSVLVFSRLSSELFVGVFNTLLALLGMTSAYYLGKKLPFKGVKRFVHMGTMVCVVAGGFLFFDQLAFLLLFNMLIVTGMNLLWIPINVAHFREMKSLACTTDEVCDIAELTGYLLVREYFLTIGRVIFFSLLVFTPLFREQEMAVSQYIMLALMMVLPIVILKGNGLFLKRT